MNTAQLSIAGALIGYLGCLAITLILLLIANRRGKRILALGDRLHDLAQNAVTRHTFARNGGNNDDWIVLTRVMQDLETAVDQWGEAAHD